jgi:hypothetical protein
MEKGEVRLLGGSGCDLTVKIDSFGKQIVRKTSSSLAYNSRLELQKQRLARAVGLGLPVVEIVSEGTTQDGLAFFDMPYLVGLGAHEVLAEADTRTIKDLSGQVSDVVIRFSELEESSNPETIQSKVSSLRNSLTHRHEWFGADALEELARWATTAQLPPTFCHGDLTLENIIVVRGKAILLDFHDVFYDSWVQDYSKLLFDTQVNWSLRRKITRSSVNNKQRIAAFRNLIVSQVNPFVQQLANREIVVTAMVLMHLMRVVPYTRDSRIERELGIVALGLTRSLREWGR